MNNPLLSICIPTFNRGDLLRNNMLELIEQAKPLNIPIYISDNCSTDNTSETVEYLKEQYFNIIYHKQMTNIYEMNFATILRSSDSEYAWLLGDKNRISDGYLKNILNIIKDEEFDLIVVNSAPPKRVKNLPSKIYSNPIELLEDLGWHMSWICSLIISKALINKIDFERFSNTNFLHTAGVFDALISFNCKVLWLDEPIIQWNEKFTQPSYIADTYPIFIDSWANSILSLSPKYPLKSKFKAVKDHGIKAGHFTLSGFLHRRSYKIYNKEVYLKYASVIVLFSNVPKSILIIISIIPSWLVVFLKYTLGSILSIIFRLTTAINLLRNRKT